MFKKESKIILTFILLLNLTACVVVINSTKTAVTANDDIDSEIRRMEYSKSNKRKW